MNDISRYLLFWHGDMIGDMIGDLGVAIGVVEYKRAFWQQSTMFTFSHGYTTQPVVLASVSFDYEGGSPTSGSIVGMFPKIELTTVEVDGILQYTGAKVTWVGSVPSSLQNAYTNLVAIIGG